MAYFSIKLCIFASMKKSTELIDGDLTIYAEWFFYHLYSNEKRITDGVWFSVFAHRHYNSIKEFLPELMKVASDKELNNLIAEIKEELGIYIDILNLYMLCAYINELIREQYVVLLKEPTLEALDGLGDLEEIVFRDKEGKTVSTSYNELLQVCLESAKKYLRSKGDVIETAKMGRYDIIGSTIDKSIIQCQFAYYVATFLAESFPKAKRSHPGKQFMIAPLEQELILRLMGYFDLGLKYGTTSTENLRKLINKYKKLPYPIDSSILYLKYDDWQKKIVWDNPELKLQELTKEEEDRIWYNPNTQIKE